MITIAQIGQHIVERHKDEIARLEMEIDAELELRWEAGERKIVVTVGTIPREVIDHIAQMYRGPGKWNVGLKASKPSGYPVDYDQLEFEPYSTSVFSER